MDFLGNLCVCEGRAIPSTQSKLSDVLLTTQLVDINLLWYFIIIMGRYDSEEVGVPT